MRRCVFWILCAILLPTPVMSQSYVWPTDASRWLTSSFAESRERRFHAGVDIKTWNRTGYEVFAARAGYIWRVRVSPFGYGRAIYLKGDTGEIFLYAHLSRFATKIEEIIEAEQERTGHYTLDRTFSAGALPVTQGEVIGYSGESGVGVPHLHFEIRDSHNRPTNPLAKGFDIPDNMSPLIRAVSVVALSPAARINGDVRPVILTPTSVGHDEYQLQAPLEISGEVGFGISAWDRPGPVPNRIGVYELQLFIDDRLHFQTRYDAFNFADNRLIELDHDYLLSRRGMGNFYNLFRLPANGLSFYEPNSPWAGILTPETMEVYDAEASLTPKTAGQAGGAVGPNEKLPTAGSQTSPGLHSLRIEVADFFGNRSRLTGSYYYGPKFSITPMVVNASGRLRLRGLRTEPEAELARMRVWLSTDNGRTWSRVNDVDLSERSSAAAESLDVSLTTLHGPSKQAILKLVAVSNEGVTSYPVFAPLGPGRLGHVTLEKDFYPTYLRLEVATDAIPQDVPRLIVRTETGERVRVPLFAAQPDRYVGVLTLAPQLDGTNRISVHMEGADGDSLLISDSFYAHEVSPGKRTSVYAPDGKCWVEFSPNSAYSEFYSRIDVDASAAPEDSNFVQGVYVASPGDVPLDRGARVTMRYPAGAAAEKLGVYYEARPGKWVFVDNQVDSVRETISARVFSLERFALFQDLQAPEISDVRPQDGERLQDRRPQLAARVKDELSGLGDEDVVYMSLDGRRVPAEYDPEADVLRYRPRTTLQPGEHSLVVAAQDRSSNQARHEATFWIQ